MTQDTPLSRIETLFQAAADRPLDERAAYLDEACGDDPVTRGRVEALLARLGDDSLAGPGLPPDPATLAEGPGSVIDRYKLLQVIGEGGFGVVYMAEQQHPVVRQVALKIIKLGMDTREVVARFEAERQALAMMDHPHIARVLDAGATETGRPYFVMELVRGVAITEYCDGNNLSTRERLELFIPVCQAVQHAHQKGVIHRDIKPSNVMVTLHDGEPVPKVIDFGIAKAINQRLTQKTLFTQFHRFIGTPAYMSPEQAEMSGLDIDTRTDIYSLGVLLYELLTGTTPIDARALMGVGFAEIQRAVRELPPQRPSLRISTSGDATIAAHRRADVAGLSRTLRGDLDWIAMRALEKDRTRRYESASDFAADIRRHLENAPVEAGPPSALYRTGKFLRRNRAAVATAGLVLLVLVVGIIATTSSYLRAVGEQRQAMRAREVAVEALDEARAQQETAARAQQEEARQRLLAMAEAERARAVTDFLVNTLALADPEVARNPGLAVHELLDRAAEHVPESFDGMPEAEARVRTTIGRAYLSLAEYESAEAHLRRALELYDEHGGVDALEFADILWDLTNLAFTLQREDAYALANRSLSLAHEHVALEHPDLAELLRRFRLATQEADYDGARSLFDQSVAAAERELEASDSAWLLVARTYLSGGLALWYSPFEPETAAFYEEALAIQERQLPPGHIQIAETLGFLVGVMNRSGRAAEAESRLRASIDELRGIYPDDSRIAFNESMLGECLMFQGRFDEAEPLLLRSHATILADLSDASRFYALDALTRIVRLYDQWGKAEEAEPFREQLARMFASAEYLSPYSMARSAFGPRHAELLAHLDALDQVCGGLCYWADSPHIEDPALAGIVDGILAEADPAPAADDAHAGLLGRLLLGWAHALGPDLSAPEPRRLVAASASRLAPWRDVVPLDAADVLAAQAAVAVGDGDALRAAAFARQSWDIVRGTDGLDSWLTANVRVRIGRSLMRAGLLDEAEAVLLPAERTLLVQVGDRHRDTRYARELLAELYDRWERSEEAAAWRAPPR